MWRGKEWGRGFFLLITGVLGASVQFDGRGRVDTAGYVRPHGLSPRTDFDNIELFVARQHLVRVAQTSIEVPYVACTGIMVVRASIWASSNE